MTAVGTKLGEKARSVPELVPALRAADGLATFRTLVRREAEGLVPPTVLDSFLEGVMTEADWPIWRSRLLLQIKMVREGGRPAPGHEAGRGVGRP